MVILHTRVISHDIVERWLMHADPPRGSANGGTVIIRADRTQTEDGMADTRIVKRPESDQHALEKLDEAARLYATYLEYARTDVFPDAYETDPAPAAEEPAAESRLGIVMNPSPMGIAVYRHE